MVFNRKITDATLFQNRFLSVPHIDEFAQEVAGRFDLSTIVSEYLGAENTDDENAILTQIELLESGKCAENLTQAVFVSLYELMTDVAKEMQLSSQVFKDTSSSSELYDTHSRMAKIDIIFLAEDYVGWDYVVSLLELKPTLTDLTLYKRGLGQIQDRVGHLHTKQKGRKETIAVLASFTEIEVFQFTVSRILTSEKMPLKIHRDNPGFRTLCGMFLGSTQLFGYTPVSLPSRILVDGETLSGVSQIYNNSENMQEYRVCCRVYRTQLNGETVVVKAAGLREQEIHNLQLLKSHNISGIPELISEQVYVEFEHEAPTGFVMRPFGHRIPELPLKALVTILQGVLTTISDAFEKCGILYTDLSLSNIMVHNGRSLLVDWQHALRAPIHEMPCHNILYSSIKVLNYFRTKEDLGCAQVEQANFEYTLDDSIESLFYVAMDCLRRNRPWTVIRNSFAKTVALKAGIYLACFSEELSRVDDLVARRFIQRFHDIVFRQQLQTHERVRKTLELFDENTDTVSQPSNGRKRVCI